MFVTSKKIDVSCLRVQNPDSGKARQDVNIKNSHRGEDTPKYILTRRFKIYSNICVSLSHCHIFPSM